MRLAALQSQSMEVFYTCTAVLVHEIVEVVGHDADNANLQSIFFDDDIFLIIDRKLV